MFGHMNIRLHFTCLTFLLFVIAFPHAALSWWFRGTREWKQSEYERREFHSVPRLQPLCVIGAGLYLPWLGCSTETWADIKRPAKKVQALVNAPTQTCTIIFTSSAPIAYPDVSWLAQKLKAHMPAVIHILVCFSRGAHVATRGSQRHSHRC